MLLQVVSVDIREEFSEVARRNVELCYPEVRTYSSFTSPSLQSWVSAYVSWVSTHVLWVSAHVSLLPDAECSLPDWRHQRGRHSEGSGI